MVRACASRLGDAMVSIARGPSMVRVVPSNCGGVSVVAAAGALFGAGECVRDGGAGPGCVVVGGGGGGGTGNVGECSGCGGWVHRSPASPRYTCRPIHPHTSTAAAHRIISRTNKPLSAKPAD